VILGHPRQQTCAEGVCSFGESTDEFITMHFKHAQSFHFHRVIRNLIDNFVVLFDFFGIFFEVVLLCEELVNIGFGLKTKNDCEI
jgi:hypothetical protein